MTNNSLVFAFGRMNPPTTGHQELIDIALETGRTFKADVVLFLSKKQDAKNPLTHAEKIKLIRKAYPSLKFGPESVSNPILALDWAKVIGYTDIHFIAGSDRSNKFDALVNSWIKHNQSVNVTVQLHNTVRGVVQKNGNQVSGTVARQLAMQGKLNQFRRVLIGTPDINTAKDVMAKIQSRLNRLTESSILLPEVEWCSDDDDSATCEFVVEGNINEDSNSDSGVISSEADTKVDMKILRRTIDKLAKTSKYAKLSELPADFKDDLESAYRDEHESDPHDTKSVRIDKKKNIKEWFGGRFKPKDKPVPKPPEPKKAKPKTTESGKDASIYTQVDRVKSDVENNKSKLVLSPPANLESKLRAKLSESESTADLLTQMNRFFRDLQKDSDGSETTKELLTVVAIAYGVKNLKLGSNGAIVSFASVNSR